MHIHVWFICIVVMMEIHHASLFFCSIACFRSSEFTCSRLSPAEINSWVSMLCFHQFWIMSSRIPQFVKMSKTFHVWYLVGWIDEAGCVNLRSVLLEPYISLVIIYNLLLHMNVLSFGCCLTLGVFLGAAAFAASSSSNSAPLVYCHS